MTAVLTRPGVDAWRWPDVAAVPRVPVKAAIAAALLRRVRERLGIGDDLLVVHRPDDFCRRLGAGGLIGFGESYQAGDWDSADLPALVGLLAAHVGDLVPRKLQWIRRFHSRRMPQTEIGSVANAGHNIARHYDLSNELFGSFLDETRTYSSALFDSVAPAWENLATAQRRKIDRLLDLTGVGRGTRVLEIGTGWGELALRAAQRGARVDTVTLSSEQRALVLQRARAAGLDDRISVQLKDYRKIEGRRSYDVILSVEMIEAVGEAYWPDYFSALRRLITPTGRIGLQSITMDHQRMLATRHTYTWIQKYVFPGGLIPSPEVIEGSGLRVLDRLDFGGDYAHTLRLWRRRFASSFEGLRPLGFDDTFRRTWELYLAYSEAGFASGYLNVHQYILGAPQ